MSKGPWIRFFPSDWLAGTRGMTAAETGIYITLISMMYERGEPIQMDHSRLARLCGTTPAAMKDTLTVLIDDGKLILRDSGLWNDRVEVETKIRSEKIIQAGKSAKTRWKKDKQNQGSGDADAMRTHCNGNANQNQNQNQKGEIDESISPELTLIEQPAEGLPKKESGFDGWWAQYPRKIDKKDSKKIYERLVKSGRVTEPELLAAAMRYAAEKIGKDQIYIKNPKNWLSGECWLNEPQPQQPDAEHPLLAGVRHFINSRSPQ